MEFCIVAFIDVLGFSEMVKKDTFNNNELYLTAFRSILGDVKKSFTESASGLDVKMFSDSIVLAAPLEPKNFFEVLRAGADMQRRFLLKGILLRGGISYGKHYSDSTVIFSDGLISAYAIESKLAKYPRIVIDPNLLDYFVNHDNVGTTLKQEASQLMIQDRDRVSFAHYLNQDFELLSTHITELIQKQLRASEAILEKLRWLSDYHAMCAESYGQPRLEVPSWFTRMQHH